MARRLSSSDRDSVRATGVAEMITGGPSGLAVGTLDGIEEGGGPVGLFGGFGRTVEGEGEEDVILRVGTLG
jgi:hypothetical protein